MFSAYRFVLPVEFTGRRLSISLSFSLSAKSAGSRLGTSKRGQTNGGGGMGWVRVLPMRCNSDMGHKVMTSPTGRKPCSSSAIVCSVTGLQVHCTLSLYTDTPARPRAPVWSRLPATLPCSLTPVDVFERVDKIGYRMKNRGFQSNTRARGDATERFSDRTIRRMRMDNAVM